MPASLSIIGAGRLGQTLAKLWHDQACFKLEQIYRRSAKSCLEARDFIGAESAICANTFEELHPCDIWLIATPDSAFANTCEKLKHTIRPGDIVFHCSGALSSDELTLLKQQGAFTASIHPLHSFARPAQSVTQFAGSHCACEGDENALNILRPAFENIGGQCFRIEGNKWLYHAGSVIACNYLAPLMEASYQAFAAAGIDQKLADTLLQPLLSGTLENIRQQGPATALTGPIARGDHDFVSAQWQALNDTDSELAELYRDMAKYTTRLALQRDNSEELNAKLQKLRGIFEE
ncbi:Rossmann-like and DUF2520 domain-containing protein [Pseudoteredinibacter isoporae]|uniref:Putative short-subunit dehydrogenase-like oxidoreductase (DUF2520 family) n=1 Tax=Pseudoteredinibacter isoporae TaxID=570281 RepID=A0A7X0JVH0_9GAMM|nr:DUF2520 domain-containing protein [Pseudoteredinibacter isoporae]MBB6522051.1 putative short-subunit dehydrogenase-like oxidoreductase (DUF2520 family) [Pseudoteredinibacter isoporae]NHO87586.1 DUF2520 domain-containing protein [Pseudoteredinibacter isoporae]NIB24083.1 DUF2520 domain-containing protein [Pseudoteredinibacter isoporae]